MTFPPGYLDELRRRVDLPGLIGKHVALKRRGRNSVGLCPFHHEKTPSFTVYPDHYHCFGCLSNGTAIDFAMHVNGQDFRQAVEWLAGEVGMGPAAEIDPEARRKAERETAERKRREREQRERRAEEAAADAANVVKTCRIGRHPYMATKGFGDEPVLIARDGRMVIPIWNARGVVRSLEYVEADGNKRFPPGGEIAGNFHRLGRAGYGEIWLAEGYATGLSIRAALRRRSIPAEVRVCFSSGNLKRVGLDALQGRRTVWTVADHDWWRCANKHRWDATFDGPLAVPDCPQCGLKGSPPAGEKAAREIGRPYWLPPEAGQDANDYHLARGLDALASELRAFRYPLPETEM